MSLRIKNFAVGERGVYSTNDDYFKQQRFVTIDSPENLDWYTGEVHILDTSIIPDTPRRRLEDDANSRKFIGKLREFYANLTSATRVHSAYLSGKKHVDDAAKALAEFNKAPAERKEEKRSNLTKGLKFLETDERKSLTDSKSKVAKEQGKVLATPDLRDRRQVLIQEIARALKKGSKTDTGSGQKKSQTSPPKSSGTETEDKSAADPGDEQLRESITDAEKLFQALTRIIGEVLGEDSEEYKAIASQTETLFVQLGLF